LVGTRFARVKEGDMALQWTSALSVGIPELDTQHAALFERVDRLHGAMLARDRAEAARLLHFLRDYVQLHFTAEEQLMARTRYPGREAHQEEHAAFARVVESLSRNLYERGVTAELVHTLDREVTRWLSGHIYSTDLAFGRYVRARRGEEAR
jgi:hemerythrin